jgi:hypothetical protein
VVSAVAIFPQQIGTSARRLSFVSLRIGERPGAWGLFSECASRPLRSPVSQEAKLRTSRTTRALKPSVSSRGELGLRPRGLYGTGPQRLSAIARGLAGLRKGFRPLFIQIHPADKIGIGVVRVSGILAEDMMPWA